MLCLNSPSRATANCGSSLTSPVHDTIRTRRSILRAGLGGGVGVGVADGDALGDGATDGVGVLTGVLGLATGLLMGAAGSNRSKETNPGPSSATPCPNTRSKLLLSSRYYICEKWLNVKCIHLRCYHQVRKIPIPKPSLAGFVVGYTTTSVDMRISTHRTSFEIP